MFPERFIERIRHQPYIDPATLLDALESPSPVSIRINPEKWHMNPSGGEPVRWCKYGFYLDFRPSFTLDPLFHAGAYYPQEASGMFLEMILSQLDLEGRKPKILDLCGAPGGKSTHLATLAGSNGTLIANEVIRSRAAILTENLSRWGSYNTFVTQNDPADFRKLENFFDLILVDAPCSGEGMFRDPVAVKEWSEQSASHCAERQKRILSDVWPALRNKGYLIYSTCTFNPEENESNIQWLAGKSGAKPVRLEIKDFPGIKEIIHRDIFGYGFYPGQVKGEGLFYSVMMKNEKTGKTLPVPGRNYYFRPGNTEIAVATEWTEFQAGDLIKSNDGLIAVADVDIYNQLLHREFRVIKAGTGIFTVKKKNYVPSHELALSSKLREDAFPVVELGYEQALKYLKRGVPATGELPSGWLIFKYRGINLGFANNIGHRLNNYYPVGWRIRMDLPPEGTVKIIDWTL